MPLKRRAPSLSFAQAYHAAQSFLVHIGATPTRLDEPADGIVEFEGNGFFGRLRYDDAPLAQGAILGLLRQIEDDEGTVTPILFSATGFSGAAEVFGENLDVALFTIAPSGDMLPRSPSAHHLMPAERFEPPFAPEEPEEDGDRPPGVWLPGQSGIADHEWIDCTVCGTTHHPEANYCHKCGASLVRKQRVIPTARRRGTLQSGGTAPIESRRQMSTQRPRSHDHAGAMRCRNCGFSDIDVLRD